jgi:hypothetical protein
MKDYADTYIFEDRYLRRCQNDLEVWKVKIDKIKVLTHYSGMNGDNDTDIVILIDLDGNRYSIDFMAIKNYDEVILWLKDKYNFGDIEVEIDKEPRIFYPKELIGVKPFDNSIQTWLIRNMINSGDGRLSKRVKDYLKSNRQSS